MTHSFVVECYIAVEFDCPCEDECGCDRAAKAVERVADDVRAGTSVKDFGEVIER